MNKLWDKFGNWFRDMNPMKVTILFMLAFALGLCLMKICFIAPYPPGIFLNSGGNYQLNTKGIVYTSSPLVPLTYPFTGNADWGFLEDADPESFEVMSKRWSKDKTHVWFETSPLKGADPATAEVVWDYWGKDKSHVWWFGEEVRGVDALTFQLGSERYVELGGHLRVNPGVPKDKYHVFVYDDGSYRPMQCDIDPATAEYFIKNNFWDDFIRDKNHVYLDDQLLDVDRNTFHHLSGDRYADKDYIYTIDSSEQGWQLRPLKSSHNP